MTSPSEPFPNEAKKWSHKYDQCVVCKLTDYPHIVNGLCSKCYYLAKKEGELKIEQKRDLLLKRQNRHSEIENESVKIQRDPSKPWSRKYDRCVQCGDNQTRHVSRDSV